MGCFLQSKWWYPISKETKIGYFYYLLTGVSIAFGKKEKQNCKALQPIVNVFARNKDLFLQTQGIFFSPFDWNLTNDTAIWLFIHVD